MNTASQELSELSLKKAIAWLWDFERARIAWATEAAVLFWKEATLPSLLGRAFGPRDVFVVEIARLRSSLGASASRQRLVVNPEGRTIEAVCRVRLHPISQDRQGALIEVETLEEEQRSLGTLAGATLADSAPIALALYHVDGQLVTQSLAAKAIFGSEGATDLMTRLGEREIAGTMILRALGDGAYSRTLAIATVNGPRLHRVTAQAAQDPRTGAPALAVSFEDVQDAHDLWRDVMQAFQGLSQLSKGIVPGEEASQKKTASTKPEALEELAEMLPLPLILLGNDGQLDYVNGAAFRLLVRLMDRVEPMGLARRLTKARLADLLVAADRGAFDEALHRARDAKTADLFIRHRAVALDRAWSSASGMTLSLGVLRHHDEAVPFALLGEAAGRESTGEAAADVAERKLRLQAEFIAQLSHELRTPLNAIIGFSQIMLEERFGPIDNPKYKSYLDIILKGSNLLLDLINDLLDLSKSDAGKLKLEPVEVDLPESIRTCVALIEPAAEAAGVTIRTLLAAPLPSIVADERSVRQILLNLLGNAVKFSRRGGAVSVSAEARPDGAVALEIRDSGIGMSADELELALEPYGQVRAPRHIRSGQGLGTGLGLPLAKALTEANKAEFAIDSAPGRGTRVTLTFPSALVLGE